MNPIKAARRRAGLSQWELAQRLKNKISQSSISVWETGYRQPGPEQVALLASALGVEPAELLEKNPRRRETRAS